MQEKPINQYPGTPLTEAELEQLSAITEADRDKAIKEAKGKLKEFIVGTGDK